MWSATNGSVMNGSVLNRSVMNRSVVNRSVVNVVCFELSVILGSVLNGNHFEALLCFYESRVSHCLL